MKKVAVLLATYNGEKYISQQIQSLLLNFSEVPNVSCEIFISDDNSTDTTLDIIREYIDLHSFIYLIDNNKKNGANLNFQFLIKNVASSADYIFFCDQDDFWLPNKIKIFISEFEALENFAQIPVLLHSDLTVADQNLFPISLSMFYSNKLNKSPNFYNLLSENIVTGCVCAINKYLFDILKKCDFTNSIMHDHYMGLIGYMNGKVVFIDKSTILYRQHDHNVIGTHQVKLFSIIFSFKKISRNLMVAKKSVINCRNQALSLLSEKNIILPIRYENLLIEYIDSFEKGIIKRSLLVLKGVRKKSWIKNIIFIYYYIFYGKKLISNQDRKL